MIRHIFVQKSTEKTDGELKKKVLQNLFLHISVAIQLSCEDKHPSKGDIIIKYIYTKSQHKNLLCRIIPMNSINELESTKWIVSIVETIMDLALSDSNKLSIISFVNDLTYKVSKIKEYNNITTTDYD